MIPTAVQHHSPASSNRARLLSLVLLLWCGFGVLGGAQFVSAGVASNADFLPHVEHLVLASPCDSALAIKRSVVNNAAASGIDDHDNSHFACVTQSIRGGTLTPAVFYFSFNAAIGAATGYSAHLPRAPPLA